MDCQQVQQLLVFLERKSEELDAVERNAVLQHLAKCPACQTLAEAEQRADDVIGAAMRDVALPADLQQKVMKRLSDQRSRLPWKRATAAIAALVLIALGFGWYMQPLPEVTDRDLAEIEILGLYLDEPKAREFVAAEGMQVVLPRNFDYQHLRRVEIVEFKKQRVVKLTFHADFGDNQISHAEVLILPHRQFRVASLASKDNPGATRIHIVHEGDFTYAIYFQGDLELLQHALRG